ncbi:MAG: amidase family protein [Oscillospiraceae bacterium]|nr:amidase family protein [Oscillospiraceae bacterium]
MQKGLPATAGSKSLEGFIAPFDATVVTLLGDKTGRFKLGEFGLSKPKQLPDGTLLCNDVFGHIRRMAAENGMFYIRPTYGTVSRYGLIPTASSMDQIGILCKDPNEGFALLEQIAVADAKDGAMAGNTLPKEEPPRKRDISEEIQELVLTVLAYAEISNNISRYDGVKFGFRAAGCTGLESLYTKTRTEGLGLEAKLAAVTGCAVLSQEHYETIYVKAMKIRRLIKESVRFDKAEIVKVTPGSPLAVLCGLPSLTFSHKGEGIQLIANVSNEKALLSEWEAMQ